MLAISDMMDVKLRTALQTELQPIKDDIRDLKEHVQSLEHHMEALENKTNRDIRLLAENYIPAAKQYEQSAAQIESIQTDLNLVKKVVTEHSKKLEKLA